MSKAPLNVPRSVLLVGVMAVLVSLPTLVDAADTGSVESEIESLRRELESEASEDATPTRDEGADTGTITEAEGPPDETVNLASDSGSAGGHRPHDRRGRVAESGGQPEVSAVTSMWDLYRDPILCALVAGAILGLLGVYVVARRIVFVSAALSQVSALGITIGFFAVAFGGWTGILHNMVPPTFAVLLAIPVVFLLVRADDSGSLPRDAVLGAAFVIPMALVLILGPYIPQEMHEIESILHGSAVLVSTTDLYAVAGAGALVLATQIVAFRAFVFASLDPLVARTQGIPVGKLDALLFGSIALMTGLVTRALGALPTFALTVLPAVGALRLKIGLAPVFATAAVAGAIAGAGGYGLAYVMNWSVGASQTLLAALLMFLLRFLGRLME